MAAPDPQTQLQAEMAPEFQIVRLLGEGAMARVYVARESALGRLVAIKVLNAEVAEDETARKRFERESRSAAKIHHHNVATVHRVGSLEDGTPFIIMEYIEGRNLADGLQAQGAMTIEQARQTLSQVASALAAAHDKGIVHRDVKPDNVIREKDSDRVVLTDFGIAGILETGTETITHLTQQGQLLGDPRYMSPEQLLGENVTDESDVYSLGIMGYELLTLKAPYEGTTSVQLITAHLKKEPIPLLSLRPDADPFLGELLERCLSKNPQHRPRAAEVAKTLAQVSEESRNTGSLMDSGSFAHQNLAAVAPDVPAFVGFVEELRRRHVFNVVIFYVVGAFSLLAFGADVFEYLPMIPGDVQTQQMPILVALTLGAFPVILVLSWMYDVSSKGISRTESSVSEAARTKLRVMQASGLVLSFLLSGLVGWLLWP
jgi:serine/threonine-protein kinase